MKDPWDVIIELQCEPSKLNKEWILEEQAKAGNKELFTGLRYALSPFTTFGIKEIPFKADLDKYEGATFISPLTWDEFEITCRALKERNLTGNEAKTWIWNLMASCENFIAWDSWYRLILQKDLRAGITLKTVNKAVKRYPEYSIPVFECQLAHDSSKHLQKLVGNKIIETKLDGIRCIAWIFRNGTVKLFSRNGKPFENFPLIEEELKTVCKYLKVDIVLDGEIMSSSFQDLLTQFRRKHDVEVSDAIYYVFDWMPLDEFSYGTSQKMQLDRTAEIPRFIPDTKKYVRQVGWTLIHLEEEEEKFKELNNRAIKEGYEGLMIKEPGALYKCKRSTNWLKLKPQITVTLVVKDIEEGQGKASGMTGALICEGKHDGYMIKVSVGSGFSDELRADIWANQEGTKGKLVEVIADAVTIDRYHEASLRFPRFKCFRGFEPGEQL